MNLALLFSQDFTGGDTVRLTGRRHEQITKVLNSQVGDTVRVGLLNDKMGLGTITNITANATELTVTLDQAPPPALPLRLITALARPPMMRRIFSAASEFGIKDIVVLHTKRVEKSFWQSPSLATDKINELLYLGLEQARDTVMPTVTFEQRFKPFVEDKLPSQLANTKPLIAHPATGTACPTGLTEHVTLAVGPEGGFIPYEVEKFTEQGFQPIHLGPRIYKVENAISVLAARLFT